MPRKAEIPSEERLEAVATILANHFQGGMQLAHRVIQDGYEITWRGFGVLTIRHFQERSQYKFRFSSAVQVELEKTGILEPGYTMEFDSPSEQINAPSEHLSPNETVASLASRLLAELSVGELVFRYQRVRGRCTFAMPDLFTIDFYEGKFKFALNDMLQARFIECGVLGSYYRSRLS